MRGNSGTRVGPVNIAFYSSGNAALIERKTLQYTSLSIIYKTPSWCIERNKNPSLYILGRPCLCLNTLRGSETTLKPGFF